MINLILRFFFIQVSWNFMQKFRSNFPIPWFILFLGILSSFFFKFFFFFFCPLSFNLYVWITSLEKESQIFSPVYFRLASSWSMTPAEASSTMKPNWWDGGRLFYYFSRSFSCTSNLGLITPHLVKLSASFITIFPAL